MFRVAVILNESELLRSGYANVTPKLRKLPRMSGYVFESFTVVNIASLFQEGSSSLKQFDSLIITTNATSDVAVLDILRKNRQEIDSFLDMGKGIFIASQKKLSASQKNSSRDAAPLKEAILTTEFLPEYYEFCTRSRPKPERDSGVGRIAIPQGSENHPIMGFPKDVSSSQVEERCKKNEFRRHFYRSHLEAVCNEAYQPILVDSSYPDPASRVLLMVSKSPRKQERVVVSTIALDWEFHESLLSNILSYVTEGLPRVAFIKHPNTHDGDYDFLLTSAKLSKIPHIIYPGVQSIPANLEDIHNTYIFSRGWTQEEIIASLHALHPEITHDQKRKIPYRRIYFFQNFDNFLTLTQHSTFSTIDLIVERSSAWLSSKFSGSMWGRSFWITHDVLQMMLANEIDVSSFVSGVLRDIKDHYLDGSYDGVMGATCGLLDLMVQLQRSQPAMCEDEGFGQSAVMEVIRWITSNFEAQSMDDRWTAYLSLTSRGADFKHEDLRVEESRQQIIHDMLQSTEDYLRRADLKSEHVTEMDMCKFISLGLMHKTTNASLITEMLNNLHKRQCPAGEWHNIGRTAHVVVFLLRNWEVLTKSLPEATHSSGFEDMIYNGVLFLRSKYHWHGGNWRGDLQATANASHAMALYNRRYKHSTQEFVETIENDSRNILSANLIRTLGGELVTLREQANTALSVVEQLTETNKQNDRLLKFEPIWRHLSFSFGALILGLMAYLFVEHRSVVVGALKAVGALSIMVGLVVGLATGWFINKGAGYKKLLAGKK